MRILFEGAAVSIFDGNRYIAEGLTVKETWAVVVLFLTLFVVLVLNKLIEIYAKRRLKEAEDDMKLIKAGLRDKV